MQTTRMFRVQGIGLILRMPPTPHRKYTLEEALHIQGGGVFHSKGGEGCNIFVKGLQCILSPN